LARGFVDDVGPGASGRETLVVMIGALINRSRLQPSGIEALKKRRQAAADSAAPVIDQVRA
jgi:hypothetical protein